MLDRPLIALTVGDPAGIGPEIVRAAMGDASVLERARIVVIGPESERPRDVARIDAGSPCDELDVAWLVPEGPTETWTVGSVQASAGRVALAALRLGAQLASDGSVDALVTAPVSKHALAAAGTPCEGQTELFGRWAGTRVEMLVVADTLRVLLLTRHMPLRAALDLITTERVHEFLCFLDAGLEQLGVAPRRIALAGLNPHAGEAGLLGSEEIDLLQPAALAARADGVDVTGPESPDTVFRRASLGEFDAVLALYHDQAFIPIKLAAPTTGWTVLLGLPFVRVSPIHGTAFDIAGHGIADPSNLIHALHAAAKLARQRASFAS